MNPLKDAVTMAVMHERLVAIAEDIGHVLIRGAFSTNIKERRDCSTALFDVRGRLIAQADHMPIHIGSLLWGVRSILEQIELAQIEDGDSFILNDPYLAGGTHLPDISLIKPVFVEGVLRYFTGNIAHHADVGGPVPGSVSGRSTSIYAEGLRIPPIKIERKGVIDRDLLRLLTCNMRGAEERRLDLETQIGANRRGGELLEALIEEAGLDVLETAIADLILYASRRIEAEVEKLPDGVYTAKRYLDDDGIGDEPVPLCVTLTIEGGTPSLDFEGSGAQAQGAVNLSKSSLEATIAYCLKALLAPDCPANSGLIDVCRISAPQKSIVNPCEPAAVAARAVTSNRLAGAIFDAFAQALPEQRKMAASNDSTSLLAIAGEGYVYPESIGGGGGAFSDSDGADAIHVHTVNSTNLPIEMMENEYRLRCTHYGLVADSGGAGRHRGGLGIAREIEVLTEASVTLRSDGHKFPAPGLSGGKPGSVTHIWRNGSEELPSKATLSLHPGDTILVETLGGGGMGDPSERAAAALAQDLEDEKVSPEARARRDYGEELFLKASSMRSSGG